MGHRPARHPVLDSRPRTRDRAHDRERGRNAQQQAHRRGHLLTGPEMALMQQWLTTLADAPSAALPAPLRRPRRSG